MSRSEAKKLCRVVRACIPIYVPVLCALYRDVSCQADLDKGGQDLRMAHESVYLTQPVRPGATTYTAMIRTSVAERCISER